MSAHRALRHLLCLAAMLLAAPAGAGEPVAFVDVTVLSMEDGSKAPGQTVLVAHDRIFAIGPVDAVDLPDDVRRIDGAGRYLMPGLAEMHAHVPPGAERPPARALEDLLFLYLANGVTTIRGMLGSPWQLELRRELRKGSIAGPNFYVGAPSINGNSAPTPEDAERLLRAAHAAGYDLQKIHPGLSRATWDRMVAVAAGLGFSFAGHVPEAVGIDHALATGMSTIDHMDGYLEAARRADESYDEARMRELAAETARRGTWIVPTQYLWENLHGLRRPDEALAQPEMRYVSAAQHQAWRNQAAQWGGLEGEALEAFVAARQAMLRLLHEAGAPLLMGTDSPQLYNVPGFALHREIARMEAAGVDRLAILQSGTRNVGRYAAQALGETEPFGLVAEGHRADLLLLDADPLADLGALARPAGVMVRGRWLDRAAIEAGLEAIATRHAAD